jgi:hypothetical protein
VGGARFDDFGRRKLVAHGSRYAPMPSESLGEFNIRSQFNMTARGCGVMLIDPKGIALSCASSPIVPPSLHPNMRHHASRLYHRTLGPFLVQAAENQIS